MGFRHTPAADCLWHALTCGLDCTEIVAPTCLGTPTFEAACFLFGGRSGGSVVLWLALRCWVGRCMCWAVQGAYPNLKKTFLDGLDPAASQPSQGSILPAPPCGLREPSSCTDPAFAPFFRCAATSGCVGAWSSKPDERAANVRAGRVALLAKGRRGRCKEAHSIQFDCAPRPRASHCSHSRCRSWTD